MPSNQLYASFFGLKERPFSLLPDPDFLFWSPQHNRAFLVLEYGIMSKAPITLITGEIGAGKTTLVQKLLSKIRDDTTIGLISNAQGGRGELIQWVLNSLNVEVDPGASYVQMFQVLQDFLLKEYALGRMVVLIFDEAQNLSLEGLEELRMLTNINANKDVLIQLILVGQPELRDMVQNPNMKQLAQRIAANFHLSPMSSEITQDYISHRLKTAGGTGQEFTFQACRRIFEETGGIPRLVNQLCDFAMLYAWSANELIVTEKVIHSIIEDGVYMGQTSATEKDTV
ncbi:AAA family ATPase [uncultured Shimia sp.]|uniref:ExeA family protein n=1 Tax=uncultured Shimia sp. TaxID=573152 RepID=UPI00262F0DAC|nr:AAA family ATPase [uncultured Shimia sp.]